MAELDGVVAGGLETDAGLAEPEQGFLTFGIDVDDFREVHEDAVWRQTSNEFGDVIEGFGASKFPLNADDGSFSVIFEEDSEHGHSLISL